ncbi:hypothetical protein [Blastococcus brunescens]|uniref:DUF222 domain-containing protein n=1 Tax=Blastococcus brunescens TaxID=1564165 RepID=A0ABZ1AVW0_9ACTN|nr:hypothetical protein [Blastococcus sp. BMG 8361]WRL62282.1 hypothetical protein U6N30_19870 [Blastococcus sp. BMG 8361]
MADRARIEALIAPPETDAVTEFGRRVQRLDRRRRAAAQALWQRAAQLPEPIRRLLAVRIPELVDYQDGAYAAPTWTRSSGSPPARQRSIRVHTA